MCEFSYCMYSGCKHRFIEVTSYCAPRLWKAGMTGTLKTCREVIYKRTLANFRKSTTLPKIRTKADLRSGSSSGSKVNLEYWWSEMSGFCKKCEDEFKMPKVAHYAAHDSFPIIIIQKEPKDQDQTRTSKQNPTPARRPIVPPLSFDSTYSPFYNLPEPSEEPVVAQLEFDHPFIYTHYINRTVYSLLEINDDYDAETSELPYYLYFPPNFAVYDPDTESDWSSHAHYMGAPWQGSPNPYLTANGGLTKADKAYIKDALRFMEMDFLWKRDFKSRGLDFGTFKFHAQKPEVFPSEE
ncbi:hypothetical protein N431DRAFT_507885 [Stipitochalara longipes BDJ]|nr:hypothetical protein N431DRAFT_507885 [Stipitochalara longipes BDJ]